MLITQIYEQIQTIHTGISRNRFCTEYLGKDRNYMNVLLYRGSDISKAALLRLYKQLRFRATQWEQMSAQADAGSDVYRRRHQQYQQLSEQVMHWLLS